MAVVSKGRSADDAEDAGRDDEQSQPPQQRLSASLTKPPTNEQVSDASAENIAAKRWLQRAKRKEKKSERTNEWYKREPGSLQLERLLL